MRSNEKPCVCNALATIHSSSPVNIGIDSSQNVNYCVSECIISKEFAASQDFGTEKFLFFILQRVCYNLKKNSNNHNGVRYYGVQTKDFCKYCGKEYTKGGMLRHLAACKNRKEKLDSETGKKKCGYFELVISGKYNNDYWLIIEMRETATLKDLDQFIRDSWVECCGYLSAFEINGIRYEAYPCTDSFWDPPAKSMSYKLKDIIEAGQTIQYEYDFGSMTDLVVKVHSYRIGAWKKEKVTILSRNNPLEILCGQCEKNKAQWVDPQGFYDGNPFWCEECMREEVMEEDIVFYSILGRGRDCYGIAVYEGYEGLNKLMMLTMQEHLNLPADYVMFSQKNLTYYWGNRDELSDEQRKIIKELGYKYRGKNQWLYFMSFEPGYFPYNLNQNEVVRMTEYFRNLELALQYYEKMDAPVDFGNGEMFYFEFGKDKQSWDFGARPLPFTAFQFGNLIITDEELLHYYF